MHAFSRILAGTVFHSYQPIMHFLMPAGCAGCEKISALQARRIHANLRNVIRSHLRDAVRFWVEKEIRCSPVCGGHPVGNALQAPRSGVPPHPRHRLDLIIDRALKPPAPGASF